jgi:hypothetical protein
VRNIILAWFLGCWQGERRRDVKAGFFNAKNAKEGAEVRQVKVKSRHPQGGFSL